MSRFLSAIAFGFLLSGCSEASEETTESLQVGELVGELYFISDGSCGLLGEVMETGQLLLTSIFERGPCGAGSQFECRSDRCFFACTDFAGTDTTVLYQVYRTNPDQDWTRGDVFVLTPPAPPEPGEEEDHLEYIEELFKRQRAQIHLFRTRTDCELARTQFPGQGAAQSEGN